MATAGALGRVQPIRPRTAALVVGSAKAKGTSVSENLARALSARLEAEGVTTAIHAATDFLREERARSAAGAVAAADLFVLVTPLYVDAFPALATHALEYIAAARSGSPAPAQFAAIVNCGFPEPEHIRTALRIARHFAAAAHYDWAGGLPLGGGGAVNPRTPLDAQHGPAMHVRSALDLAAPCLARGDAIATDAIEQMAASPMPDAAYRLLGDLGWRYQVYKNGLAQAALRGASARLVPGMHDDPDRARRTERSDAPQDSLPLARCGASGRVTGIRRPDERGGASDGRRPGFAPAGPMRSIGPRDRIRRPDRAKRSRAMVGATGFEPATSRSQSERSTRLSYAPSCADPDYPSGGSPAPNPLGFRPELPGPSRAVGARARMLHCSG